MMHINPKRLENMVFQVVEKSSEFPFFPIPYLVDRKLSELFLSAFNFLNFDRSFLERDTGILNFFAYLITHHAKNFSQVNFAKPARSALLNARDYLHEHYAENVTLEKLAKVAGLSQFHFCRAFRKAIGVSPHVYQIQVRIDRAKTFLLQGIPIAQVASETGFYDHSHFGNYFRRLVGVTPSNYSNNFLDITK
jgi:AraC-like DNA-binding protein